jgi:hypothetical protein
MLPCDAGPGSLQMGRVVEGNDGAVVKRVVLLQVGDAAAGRGYGEEVRGRQRHPDPGGDDEGQREPVRYDDLVGQGLARMRSMAREMRAANTRRVSAPGMPYS